jgi:hypothetical protein
VCVSVCVFVVLEVFVWFSLFFIVFSWFLKNAKTAQACRYNGARFARDAVSCGAVPRPGPLSHSRCVGSPRPGTPPHGGALCSGRGPINRLEVSRVQGRRFPRSPVPQMYGRRFASTGWGKAPTGRKLAESKVGGLQDFRPPKHMEGGSPQLVGVLSTNQLEVGRLQGWRFPRFPAPQTYGGRLATTSWGF